MYLWDVATCNGISWDPGNKAQQSFLLDLVKGCQVEEAQDPALKEAGWQMYHYSKQHATVKSSTTGKTVGVSALAAVKNKEEYDALASMVRGQKPGSSGAVAKSHHKGRPPLGQDKKKTPAQVCN